MVIRNATGLDHIHLVDIGMIDSVDEAYARRPIWILFGKLHMYLPYSSFVWCYRDVSYFDEKRGRTVFQYCLTYFL